MKNFHFLNTLPAEGHDRFRRIHNTTGGTTGSGNPIDRTVAMPQSSVANLELGKFALKKVLLIVAVVFATVLLVTFVRAAGEWQQIGQTEAGDKVSVSSVRILRNQQRSALVRVEYKEPAHLPQGGPFTELRARVRFDCSSGSAVPTAEWLYTRDQSGHFVVSKKANHDELFGKAPEGGFADLVRDNVCSPRK